IEDACGVRVRGLACPHHAMANDNTVRACIDTGLDYFQGDVGESPATHGFGWYRVSDRTRPILVPGQRNFGVSDWSGRRREWPWIEEPWSSETALQRWTETIDRAKTEGTMMTIVIHPWMLHINEGEVKVVRQILRHAVEEDGWLTSYGAIVDQMI